VKMMHDAIYEITPFKKHRAPLKENIDSPTHQHYKSQFRRTFFG
jgi:hypothetical protein